MEPTRKMILRSLKALWIVCYIPVATLFYFIPLLLGFIFTKLGLAFGHHLINWAYVSWVSGNTRALSLQGPIHYDASALEAYDKDKWYLLVSNHQSWADILVLQGLFAKRLPHLTFVMKETLRWVPIIGVVCMMLNYPFVKRASMKKRKGKAARHDQKVLAETFKRLAKTPSTVVTFVEGTRFKPHKVKAPYHHVLAPKASGLSFALQSFSQKPFHLLDVTIIYQGKASLWSWILGQTSAIHVHMNEMAPPLPDEKTPNQTYKKELQSYLHKKWREKDKLLLTRRR